MSTVAANTFTDANNAGNATFRGYLNTPGGAMFRNRIINGDMRIDQRNAGASVSNGTGATANYPVDRFALYGGQASKLTGQQNAGSVTPPAGFTHYLGVTTSSAYTPASTETFAVWQWIEGLNVSDLGWGTANAQSVTLSFRVRSSLTGTFGGALQNGSQNRSYPFSFTISAANTWETKTISIAGDTSGTWATDNSGGIRLYFSMGMGSTLQGSANAWAGANYRTVTGETQVVATSGATFYITGVQLEAGTVTNPVFERRDYGMELRMCQRYFTRFVTDGDVYTFFASGATNSSTNAILVGQLPTKMRTSPTITASNTRVYDMVSSYATTTVATNRSSTTSISAEFTISGGTSGRPCMLGANNNSAGYMDASAEL